MPAPTRHLVERADSPERRPGEDDGADEGRGSFSAIPALAALFADPDARGARKWKDMFDKKRCSGATPSDILSVLPKL